MLRIVFSVLLLFISLVIFCVILDHPVDGMHIIPGVLLLIMYLFIGGAIIGRLMGNNSISSFTVYFNLVIITGVTMAFGTFEDVWIMEDFVYRADDHPLLLAIASFFLWLGLFLNKGRTNDVVDDTMDHITGILKKANDKRFTTELNQIAKSSPEGKKAVESLLNQQEELDRELEEIQNRREGK